jgi:hypothetical protein
MKPIELLKDELNKYEKALQKSFVAFREGGIDSITYETHKKNLEPKIFEYKRVINIIEQWQ